MKVSNKYDEQNRSNTRSLNYATIYELKVT